MPRQLGYAILACSTNLVADLSHLERMHRLATNLVADLHYLPYEEKMQLLGLHSLQRIYLIIEC